MEKIIDIANAIRKHTEEEKDMGVVNSSMGRGYIRINGTEQQVWLTNNEYESTSRIIRGINDEYQGRMDSGITHTHTIDGPYTSKNTAYGSIFIDQKCGEYQIKVRGRDMKFTLLNSTLYSQLNWHVSNVRMVLEGEKYKYQFKTLAEIFKAIEEDTQTLNETEENIRQQQAAAEKFKKEQEEYERRLKEAEAAEAARIQAEKEKKEEEERIRQEELAKLMEKKEKIESNLHHLEEQHRHAVRFIREQASLRLQPILDPLQNQAKFAHLYDGKTLVIDGGPGTGKTTTLIQRLKLLIDEPALNDYRDNHPGFELTPAQQELVCNGDNWIFFSPTALLRLYLNDNMSYEGLTNTLSRTHVWEDYRKLLLRDYYQIAGTDMPFTFPASRIRDKKLFIGSHTDIEKQFTGFYIRYIKNMFEQIRQIETKEFAWKDTSNIIKFYCREVQAAKTLEQLIRVLVNFQNHDKLNSTEGEHSIKNITRTFSEQLTSAASLLQAHIEQDEACNHSVQALLKEWEATPVDESEQEEEEEIEETEEETIHLSHEQRYALNRRLKALLRLLALRKYDKKARLQGKNKELYERISLYIDEKKLESIGQAAFFMTYFQPVTKGIDRNMFSLIPRIYKAFRKELMQQPGTLWDEKLLEEIVKKQHNKPLHPTEQSLLLGFINNLCRSVYKYSPPEFRKLRHKYVESYRTNCRPVIGIDEATDYSLIDYYAIYSLRHYQVSNVTLCGDIMQCLHKEGIKDWKELESIIPGIKTQELKVSYRQSPVLLKLATNLYKQTIGKEAPYTCYLDPSGNLPQPLLYRGDDEQEKADWIVNRILEVRKAYNAVPSIAIFMNHADDIPAFKKKLEDNGLLEEGGIEVKDCSSGEQLTGKDTIRLFPLDKVKGMEFEVVFFHNINNIVTQNDPSLVSRYLYVGLSRATFYMAVTTSGTPAPELEQTLSYFNEEKDWRI